MSKENGRLQSAEESKELWAISSAFPFWPMLPGHCLSQISSQNNDSELMQRMLVLLGETHIMQRKENDRLNAEIAELQVVLKKNKVKADEIEQELQAIKAEAEELSEGLAAELKVVQEENKEQKKEITELCKKIGILEEIVQTQEQLFESEIASLKSNIAEIKKLIAQQSSVAEVPAAMLTDYDEDYFAIIGDSKENGNE